MNNSDAMLEAELDYAVRMVQKGYSTPEQAARVCGVRLKDVRERLTQRAGTMDENAAYRSLARS